MMRDSIFVIPIARIKYRTDFKPQNKYRQYYTTFLRNVQPQVFELDQDLKNHIR